MIRLPKSLKPVHVALAITGAAALGYLLSGKGAPWRASNQPLGPSPLGHSPRPVDPNAPAMYPTVRAAFMPFTAPLEGVLNFMYLDVKGYVTTGVGNLIDPKSAAMGLPWLDAAGNRASQQTISDEWDRIKARTDMTQMGGRAYRSVATLHLDQAGLTQLFTGTLNSMATSLSQRFPEFRGWPADAQLAGLSIAWASGPYFGAKAIVQFTPFEAALRAQDWTSASGTCKIYDGGNPGIVPRNRANAQLFMNAAYSASTGMSPDQLMWPGKAPSPNA